MSNDWDIRCADCEAATGRHVRAGYSWSHGEEHLARMLNARETLADAQGALDRAIERMGDSMVGLSGIDVEWGPESKPGHLHFFVDHRGHDLRVVSEYGYDLDQCAQRVRCDRCGDATKLCRLPRDHAGGHAP